MASDGGNDAGVCESRGGGDDGVGNEVINALQKRTMSATRNAEREQVGEGKTKHLPYRVLFLLHFLLSAILKGPLDNVGLMRGTLDMMALFKLCPEVVKVLKLDQVPNLGERGSNDGGLCD